MSAIDDQVGTQREEQHGIVCEVLPLVADARCPSDGLKSVEQFTYSSICGVDVVLGNILPDIVQIELASSPRTYELTPWIFGADQP